MTRGVSVCFNCKNRFHITSASDDDLCSSCKAVLYPIEKKPEAVPVANLIKDLVEELREIKKILATAISELDDNHLRSVFQPKWDEIRSWAKRELNE